MKKLCIVLTSLILLLFCSCSKSNDGNVMTEESSNTNEISGSSSKASEIPNSNIESSDEIIMKEMVSQIRSSGCIFNT